MDVTEVQSHLLSTMRYGSCQIAMSGLRKWVLHTNRICEVMVDCWVQRRQTLQTDGSPSTAAQLSAQYDRDELRAHPFLDEDE